MTFGNLSRRERIPHFLRKHQNAECVGNVFAALAHALADLDVLESEFFRQTLEGERTVERIEVLALQIFDDGKLKLHPIRIFARADDGGDLEETCELRGTKTPLSRNELIFHVNPLFRPLDFFARDGKRLQDAILPDGFRERKQRRPVEILARLKWIWFYALDLHPKDGVALVLTLHGKSISLPHL